MDDGAAFSSVGHRGLSICNPIGSEALDEVLAVVSAARPRTAVDVGCGKGELLIRLAQRSGCRGVGIEPNPEFVAEARAEAAARAPGLVEIREGTADEHPLPERGYDIAAVVGATHAFGGTERTLAALTRAARVGGHVLLGDGFWRRTPDDASVASLGMARDELGSFAELLHAIEVAGLEPLHVAVAQDDDWDRYEEAHLRNIEAHVRSHPDDPQAARLWERRRAWRDAYASAGRGLIGFALIVARHPASH